MRYFGTAYDAPIYEGLARCERPSDAACAWCHEAIGPHDDGFEMGAVVMGTDGDPAGTVIWYHRECHLRQTFGSVAHQQGQCSCSGGSGEDSDLLTTRQAALQACLLFYSRHAGDPGQYYRRLPEWRWWKAQT